MGISDSICACCLVSDDGDRGPKRWPGPRLAVAEPVAAHASGGAGGSKGRRARGRGSSRGGEGRSFWRSRIRDSGPTRGPKDTAFGAARPARRPAVLGGGAAPPPAVQSSTSVQRAPASRPALLSGPPRPRPTGGDPRACPGRALSTARKRRGRGRSRREARAAAWGARGARPPRWVAGTLAAQAGDGRGGAPGPQHSLKPRFATNDEIQRLHEPDNCAGGVIRIRGD